MAMVVAGICQRMMVPDAGTGGVLTRTIEGSSAIAPQGASGLRRISEKRARMLTLILIFLEHVPQSSSRQDLFFGSRSTSCEELTATSEAAGTGYASAGRRVRKESVYRRPR